MAFDPATQVSAVRALFPLLVALASLAIVPLVRSERFGPPEGAAKRASDTVTVLLVLSGIGALIAGASYASTAQFGSVRIDPSEPGRLLAALGGPVFALIVAIGEGRRIGTMGQIALFGIAVIDLALALPIGIAPIALLLFSSLAIGAAAASLRGVDDEGDLALLDEVHRVARCATSFATGCLHSSLRHLAHHALDVDAAVAEHLGGTSRRDDAAPDVEQRPAELDGERLVAIVEREKHSSARGQLGSSS